MSRFSALILSLALALAGLGAEPCPALAEQPAGYALRDQRELVTDVWQLAEQRLGLMDAVAAAKWPTHTPVTDPAREAVVIHAAGEQAARVGLAREPVENFFAVQIAAARAVQERLTAHWQRDGFDYRGPPLRLAEDLRPRLDALTAQLLTALYLAAPGLGGAGAGAAPPADDALDPESRAAIQQALAAIRLDGTGSLQRAQASGVLRIGTPADYAPFAVATGATLHGSDVELAAQLAAALQLRPVFIQTTWKTLLDELAADRFDLVVGGVSANPVRLARADASVALSRSGKTAIGRCRDQLRFSNLAAIDRSAVTVVENPGGTNESFARAHLQAAQLVIHPDNRSVFDELLAGRADVMFTDETEVRLASHRHPELCRLLPEAWEPADKVFLLARGGGWGAAVDPWLSQALAAGLPARLLEANLD
jgi:cyclohexadienyl dehydratase